MKRLIPLLLLPSLMACHTPKPPPAAPIPQAPPPVSPPVSTPIFLEEPAQQWFHEAVFYEIFVRSFQDSNGDGIGDIQGIIDRLDYLNDGDASTNSDLGITAIWLMPIMESPSYHGYDVTNYYKVEPDYGTEADLKALLDACHERGIKVILDLMLNHSSSEHPHFLDAQTNADSPYRDWYIFREDNPGWTQPWGNGPTWHRSGDEFYYGVFWGGMPDLNFDNPDVQAEYINIANHWLNIGVDGFRLDAIRHLIEDGSSAPDVLRTHGVLKDLASAIQGDFPEALLIGEIWAGPQQVGPYYGNGDELNLTYDFNTAGGLLAALQQSDGGPLREALIENLEHLPVQGMGAPFLTNHDMDRLAGTLAGDQEKLKLAAIALMTMPGTPFIYYGEEIGLKNTGIGGDEAKRAPMQWQAEGPNYGFTLSDRSWAPALGVGATYSVTAQADEKDSLLSAYRRAIHLRQSSAALNTGKLMAVKGGSGGHGLSFQRVSPSEVVVVILNFADTPLSRNQVVIKQGVLDEAGINQSFLDITVETLQGPDNTEAFLSPEGILNIPEMAPQSALIFRLSPANHR